MTALKTALESIYESVEYIYASHVYVGVQFELLHVMRVREMNAIFVSNMPHKSMHTHTILSYFVNLVVLYQ